MQKFRRTIGKKFEGNYTVHSFFGCIYFTLSILIRDLTITPYFSINIYIQQIEVGFRSRSKPLAFTNHLHALVQQGLDRTNKIKAGLNIILPAVVRFDCQGST